MTTTLLDLTEGWTQEVGPFTLKSNLTPIDLTGLTVALVLKTNRGQEVSVATRVPTQTGGAIGQAYFTPDTEALVAANSPYTVHWQLTDTGGKVAFVPNGQADRINVYAP